MENGRPFSFGDIHKAIEKGDLTRLKNIEKKFGNFDYDSVFVDETPLTRAVCSKHHDVITYLLDQISIDVNSPNRFGRTPLLLAAREGDVSLVRRLLSLGADVNQSDLSGDSPLHLAALYNYAEVIQELLNAEGNINHKNSKGMTPVHSALDNSAFSAAKTLISRGCNVNETTVDQRTPLMCVVRHNLSAGIFKDIMLSDLISSMEVLLENGADVQRTEANGNTALHYAVEAKNIYAVVHLLHHGCRANVRNSSNKDAFLLAVHSDQFEIARYITLYTSIKSLQGTNNELPLDVLRIFLGVSENKNDAGEKHTLCAKLLEKMGQRNTVALRSFVSTMVDIREDSSRDIDDLLETPTLQSLCRGKILQCLQQEPITAVKELPIAVRLQRFLLHDDPCFDVDPIILARCNVAAMEGDLDYLKNLAQTKANFIRTCNLSFDHSTAVEKAVRFEKLEVLEFLFSILSLATESISKLLHIAVENMGTSVLEFLLSNGADVNVTNSENEKPIHIAARSGNFRAVDLLINVATDNALTYDKTGKHVIHYAAATGKSDVIAMLLRQHPELVSARDTFDYSPLHLAVSRGNVYLERNISLPALFSDVLLHNSAVLKLMYSPCVRHIPLPEYAAGVSHPDVIKILMEHGADLSLWSENGTPESLAVKYGYEDILVEARP